MTARSQILLEREDVLVRVSNPGSIDARTALDVSTTLAEVSVEIGKLDPPPILENYHRTSIAGFEPLSDTFAAISAGGISGALDEIEAQRTPIDEMSAAEEIAMAECPAEWVTVADLEATPAARTQHSSAVSP